MFTYHERGGGTGRIHHDSARQARIVEKTERSSAFYNHVPDSYGFAGVCLDVVVRPIEIDAAVNVSVRVDENEIDAFSR